jgi:hypothetical protein
MVSLCCKMINATSRLCRLMGSLDRAAWRRSKESWIEKECCKPQVYRAQTAVCGFTKVFFIGKREFVGSLKARQQWAAMGSNGQQHLVMMMTEGRRRDDGNSWQLAALPVAQGECSDSQRGTRWWKMSKYPNASVATCPYPYCSIFS